MSIGQEMEIDELTGKLEELQTKLTALEADKEELKECVNKYAKISNWQYSARNSVYNNWDKAHPSDQEKINGKWVGGKWARTALKEINESK